MAEEKNLFDDFASISVQEWKEKIVHDLKGKPFDDLIWHTENGFDVEPFYMQAEIEPLEIPANRLATGWQIRQDFVIHPPSSTNKSILNALENGVDAIGIKTNDDIDSDGLDSMLKNVPLEKTPVHFFAGEYTGLALEQFLKVLENRNITLHNLEGSFDYNLLQKTDNPEFHSLIEFQNVVNEKLPAFKSLAIHSQPNQSKADTPVAELKEIMYKINRYWQALSTNNYPLSTFIHCLQFSVFIGPNYFLEIAKLRALRWLWHDWQKKQGIAEPISAFIQAQKSWKYNDSQDPYHNILLHTTEAMAAVIGGCDVLNLSSNDETSQLDNNFFERISRNIQLILKHEAHFGKVHDPARGSYYIEVLTRKLVETCI